MTAALVDGELGHAERERAHRHLAHCAGCRAEVEAQRRLKARLQGLSAPPPPEGPLASRLLGLAGEPDASLATGLSAPGQRRKQGRRPRAGSLPAGTRPRTSRRALPRRAFGGAAFVALGLSAAFALGGTSSRPPPPVVDPGSDAFVTEYVSSTSDVPPARQATLTSGGSGSGR